MEPPVSDPSDADAQVRGHRRRGAPGGAAGNVIPVPGVAGGAVSRVFRGGAHGELVHVDLAQDDRAGLAQPGADRGVIGRHEVLQDAGAAGGAQTLGNHHVFQGQGNAGERRGLAALDPGRGLDRHGPGPGLIHSNIGIQLAVPRFNAGQHGLGHLLRRDLARGQPRRQLADTQAI